jgi:hypothetical protein
MLAIALAIIVIRPALCANVELVGKPLTAKIEGEIEPGDALKSLRLYKYYGPFVMWNVFLSALAGDIQFFVVLHPRNLRRLESALIWCDCFEPESPN